MFTVNLELSKRFENLVGVGFTQKLLKAFGDIWLREWRKTSASSTYWASRSLKRPPEQSRLTPRTGRLRASISRVGGDNISRVRVQNDSAMITHGSRVPYAARQEYQNRGQRSYLRRSLHWMLDNRVSEIAHAAFAKVWRPS